MFELSIGECKRLTLIARQLSMILPLKIAFHYKIFDSIKKNNNIPVVIFFYTVKYFRWMRMQLSVLRHWQASPTPDAKLWSKISLMTTIST